MAKDKFTFLQDGLGSWQWIKDGDTPGYSTSGFPSKLKAIKNAKRHGYIPGEKEEEKAEAEESAAAAEKEEKPKAKEK